MAFDANNPVSVGAATKKTHYDVAFDNSIYNNAAFFRGAYKNLLITNAAGNGTGATFNTTTSGGVITAAVVNAGGSGYVVGEILMVAGGDVNAMLKVATLSGSAVATVTIYFGGTGYSNATGATTTSIRCPFKMRLNADALLLKNSSNVMTNATSGMPLTMDITAAVGANSLDKGIENASVWYYIYAIYNPTSAVLAGILSPLDGSGSGLTVNVTTVAAGVITAINTTPTAVGSGYFLGSQIRVTTGNGDALVRVDKVDANGGVLTIALVYGGSGGYSTGTGQATTTTLTLPSGYTYWGLFGAVYNDSGSNFIDLTQRDNKVAAENRSAITSPVGGVTVKTFANLSASIPTTTRTFSGVMLATSNAAGIYGLYLYSEPSTDDDGYTTHYQYANGASEGFTAAYRFILRSPCLCYYATTNINAALSASVYISSWEY